jgi:hypothetical protein
MDNYNYLSNLQAVNSANNDFKFPKPESIGEQFKEEALKTVSVPAGVKLVEDSLKPLTSQALKAVGVSKNITKAYREGGLTKAINQKVLENRKLKSNIKDNVQTEKNTVLEDQKPISDLPDFDDDPENVPQRLLSDPEDNIVNNANDYFDDNISSNIFDDLDDEPTIVDAGDNSLLDPSGNVLRQGEDLASDFRLNAEGRLEGIVSDGARGFNPDLDVQPGFRVLADVTRGPELDETALTDTNAIKNSISSRMSDASSNFKNISSDVNEADKVADTAENVASDVSKVGKVAGELGTLTEESTAGDDIPVVGEIVTGVLGLATLGASIASLFKKKHHPPPQVMASSGFQAGIN